MRHNYSKRGFGIIEVLIASTVIAVVAGVATVAGNSSLRNAGKMQERVQATYLAQEQIELVRQIRDSYWIDKNNATKFEGLSSLADDSKIYYLSFEGSSTNDKKWVLKEGKNVISVAGVSYNVELRFSKVGELIPKNDSANLSVESIDASAVKVTAEVYWPKNLSGVSISEVLTNWRPDF